MKKKIIIILLPLFCMLKTFSYEYTLEDVLLTYMAFIEHSNLLINRGILFLNPNQNSRIHYAEYEYDSSGNKILKVFHSEMDFEKNESYDSVCYKNNRISGVRCGHNRWNFKIEDGNLIIENEWRPLSYEMHYVSENELRCYGKKITKNGNEFTVDDYEPYKFIFNDDSIEVIKLSKAGDELYKYIYDNHGILLKEIDCHNYDSERLVWSTNGVNGYIREEVNLNSLSQYTNDDYFRRIDKDGYLVYQNDDYSEYNHYGYRELIILPCDEEDNILATVDDVAIPYPEKKKDLEENEATEVPELNHTIQG